MTKVSKKSHQYCKHKLTNRYAPKWAWTFSLFCLQVFETPRHKYPTGSTLSFFALTRSPGIRGPKNQNTMKKLILLSFIGLFMSCKKEYSCRCTFDYATAGISGGSGYSDSIIKDTKKKAKKKCEDKSNPSTPNTVGYNCVLVD